LTDSTLGLIEGFCVDAFGSANGTAYVKEYPIAIPANKATKQKATTRVVDMFLPAFRVCPIQVIYFAVR